MFRPDRIHERFKERDDVVLGHFFDLGNAMDIDLCLFTDCRGGPSRRLPRAFEGRNGLQLDFQPDLILVLEIPDSLHAGTGIAVNHRIQPLAFSLFASSRGPAARTLSRIPFTNLAASSSPKSLASSMASFTVTLAGTSSSHSSSKAPSRRMFRSTICIRLTFQLVAYLPISASISILCSSTPLTSCSANACTSSAAVYCFQNSSSQTPGLP